MTTKTIDCVECGGSVPYGRLSCPACGALLAAVKRTRPDDVQPAAAVPVAAPPPATVPRPPVPRAPAPTAPVSTYLIEPLPDPLDGPDPERSSTPWPPLEQPEPGPSSTPWTSVDRQEPALVARPYSLGTSTGAIDVGRLAPPGAYLPPSGAMSMTMKGGQDGAASALSATDTAGSLAATPATIRNALPSLDTGRLTEIAGSLVVVGSAMATLGFLLPWSTVVIGARGTGGYLDDWGLASPTHLLALAAVLAVLALGVVRTVVPAWFRTGVLGLALGGLLAGLTWPYVLGPLGADIGAMLTALGALALVVGGGIATWTSRHAEERPLV